MSYDTTDSILWPHDGPDLEPREENECPVCGSLNTFTTFDNKIVCRTEWHVTNLKNISQ